MKKVLVIGATSAIANACLTIWATEGAKLALVARNSEKLQQIANDLVVRGAREVFSYQLELTEYAQHISVLDACFKNLGEIDIVLIAQGTLAKQELAQVNVNMMIQEFNNNTLSVTALLTEISQRMIKQRCGTIAVISSVAGDRGRFSNYVYGASKAAISVFCDGLRARLLPYNVHVLTIKPGFVDTPMTKDLSLPLFLVASPQQVATSIHHAINKRKDILYVPWFWRWIMLIIKLIPNKIFKNLKI